MVRIKQINTILKNDLKKKKKIIKEKISIDIYTLKPNINNKYSYIKT